MLLACDRIPMETEADENEGFICTGCFGQLFNAAVCCSCCCGGCVWELDDSVIVVDGFTGAETDLCNCGPDR